ncbi:MAG: hypothetical protein IJY61_05145 [Candidatus Gastranaerophilales bacterium]|nr:hypothetical protein [Candidatus Gastranaerophilales bacterium]
MKKIILTLLILMTMNFSVQAKTNTNETISAIETNMFGYTFSTETDNTRLERIEKHLYGEKKKGNIDSRLKEIQDDTGYTIVKKVEQKKNIEVLPTLKEDSTVEYPMVDKLEEEVFKTTYKTEDIYKRLDRLETHIFNKTSSESLNNRVDKLASIIRPQKQIQKTYQQQNNELDNYYRNNGLEPINDDSVPFQLATLEHNILKSDYMNDNISNRLSRLEKELFSRTFPNDSDANRLQRIMVAYDAKQDSYKYENNRKMQNMATASQIGGILLMILAMIL